MALLLAKNEDFGSWRGVEEFAVRYRDAAVSLAARKQPDGIAQLLQQLESDIAAQADENSRLKAVFEQLFASIGEAAEQGQLRQQLEAFFVAASRHFACFRSPVAYFKASHRFVCAVAECCLQLSRQQLSDQLPPVALLAMGPAGRREMTRFCRMQLVLVWDGQASEELMEELGTELVSWFRVCGIALEESVSPQHGDWRGNLKQWKSRFTAAGRKRDQSELIELLRLSDQVPLIDEAGVANRFSALCLQSLGQREFVGNLVKRSQLLSNGIGMMGSLKPEKSGPHRGLFSLLDHALLPLAAAISAICLIHGVSLVGTPERLRELVRIGRMDVDLAERALHAWHCFGENRLLLEQQAAFGQDCRDILHLVPNALDATETERLRLSLETVADLQRYMQVSFGMLA